MENEWEQQKLKILNSLLGSDRDSFDFPADVIVRLVFYFQNYKIKAIVNACVKRSLIFLGRYFWPP